MRKTVTFQPDSAHLLNNATGEFPSLLAICQRWRTVRAGHTHEYTDEFLVGYDHEFRGGIRGQRALH